MDVDIRDAINDPLKLYSIVSRLFSIKLLMEEDGMRHVICPFHLDNTPSAKFYEDSDTGMDILRCFSCRKNYTSYHYFKQVLQIHPKTALLQYANEHQIQACITRLGSMSGSQRFSKEVDEIIQRNLVDKRDLNQCLEELYSGHQK